VAHTTVLCDGQGAGQLALAPGLGCCPPERASCAAVAVQNQRGLHADALRPYRAALITSRDMWFFDAQHAAISLLWAASGGGTFDTRRMCQHRSTFVDLCVLECPGPSHVDYDLPTCAGSFGLGLHLFLLCPASRSAKGPYRSASVCTHTVVCCSSTSCP
jgi:hypothetical protein